MPLYHNIVNKIVVMSRTNTVIQEIYGKVGLEGGVGFKVEADPDTNEVTIGADATAGAQDPYYVQKFNDLIKLGGGSYHGGGVNKDYVFSGGPYYISKIASILPYPSTRDRNWALLGSACMQVGKLSGTECVSGGSTDPEDEDSKLTVANMCEADVDCEDYRRIFIYLERIRKFLDANKDANLTIGTNEATCRKTIALFKQYEAAIHYWNFVVANKGFTFLVAPGPNTISLTTGYEVVVCGTYPHVCWSIAISGLAGLVVEHKLVSYRSSKTSLRPNGLVCASDSMTTHDYLLVNSIIRIDMAGSSLSSGAKAPPITRTVTITVTWTGTHIGTSSLTKTVEVTIYDRRK